jgi:alkylation response protein AidB-like acyl-CoA dehydrogenase
MGIRGSMTNPISFKDVRVPKEISSAGWRGFL